MRKLPRVGSFFKKPRVNRSSINNFKKIILDKQAENDTTYKSMDVDKGIKKYKKRQLDAKGGKEAYFFTIKNILILSLIFFTFIYIFFSGFSIKSLYIAIFIFIGITLYLLVVERFKENVEIEEEIKEIKSERVKEHNVFLDKVKEIEQVEKNQLENVILKDEEGYDKKVWKIGRAPSLLVGKKTPKNKVDVDLSDSIYSNLVSRAHGVLNRVNGIWYYEDLGSRNGSGLEKKIDGRKIKLKSYTPIKVESGDIIYCATTKILLK